MIVNEAQHLFICSWRSPGYPLFWRIYAHFSANLITELSLFFSKWLYLLVDSVKFTDMIILHFTSCHQSSDYVSMSLFLNSFLPGASKLWWPDQLHQNHLRISWKWDLLPQVTDSHASWSWCTMKFGNHCCVLSWVYLATLALMPTVFITITLYQYVIFHDTHLLGHRYALMFLNVLWLFV